MSESVNIATAGNTDDPCLHVLQQKGYVLEVKVFNDGRAYYIGSRDHCRFVGGSGAELLGLVSMWEFFGDQWERRLSEVPDILSDVTVHVRDEDYD